MEYELMKIGELAAFAGISSKALRIYEKMDLIKPVKVDPETGYRYYSPDQVQQLEALLEWKDLGFSLKEIKKLLSGKLSREDISEIMNEKIREWQEKVWVAQAKMEELDRLKDDMNFDNKDLKAMSDEERAWYLAKLVCVNDTNVRQAISEAIWL